MIFLKTTIYQFIAIKFKNSKRDMTSWHAAYCNSLTEKQYFPVCDLFSAFGSFSSASKKIRNEPEVISVAKDQKEILRKGNFILKSLWSLIPANTNERRRKVIIFINLILICHLILRFSFNAYI